MKTRLFAILTVLMLVAAACGGSTASTAPSASVDAGKSDYKACLALDVGGIGDKSFNDSAYEGLLEALDAILADSSLEPAFVAEVLVPPSEADTAREIDFARRCFVNILDLFIRETEIQFMSSARDIDRNFGGRTEFPAKDE